MCLSRAAGMSPASLHLAGRKSLVEMKDQAPKVQGKEKIQAPAQIAPDQDKGTATPWASPFITLPFVG